MSVVIRLEDKVQLNQYKINYIILNSIIIFLFTTVVIPKHNNRISVKINIS